MIEEASDFHELFTEQKLMEDKDSRQFYDEYVVNPVLDFPRPVVINPSRNPLKIKKERPIHHTSFCLWQRYGSLFSRDYFFYHVQGKKLGLRANVRAYIETRNGPFQFGHEMVVCEVGTLLLL